MALVKEYYDRDEVRSEILAYCRGRWAAVEGVAEDGRKAFIRHWRTNVPLRLWTDSDFRRLYVAFKEVVFRTIYGSVNVYRKLETDADTEDRNNVVRTSPIWDIDVAPNRWRDALEAARILTDFLEKEGVVKSVFLKWSGRGVHVHIHESAFSDELLRKHHPLDVAWAVVEYVIRSVRAQLTELAAKAEGELKIENVIDAKRVFTAPLSLHRTLDLCCVCFRPADLDDFDLSWADPRNYRHDPSWKQFEPGEADSLVLRAIAVVGYPTWGEAFPRTRVGAPGETVVREPSEARIGRFPTMALLQAARYYVLTGDEEKAKSFGLNRAIFYAWAKYHGKRGVKPRRGPLPGRPTIDKGAVKLIKVCGEDAPVASSGWFVMGGIEQRPEDYDRQVATRINAVIPYEQAWKAAVEYVRSFPEKVLTNPQKFYKEVYEPVRDAFVEKVVKRKKPRTLLDF